jgi:murein peptide amidase A
MARLKSIEPRNTWRVLPIVSPDGLKARTRYNANKVDLNRNFPSKDWDEQALKYWEKSTKKDPRRYPGPTAASESETKCLVQHIEDFKPDFIISVHTPLGVLDFDGPKVGNPGFKPLPWVGLGNFAGSLGRYMWVDNKVPVLTIELRGNTGIKKLEEFDHLQDISGTVAIQSGKLLDKKVTSQKENATSKK